MKEQKYIHQIEIEVRDYELDSEGIVNNANYLHYLEYTRHDFCKRIGFPFSMMRAKGLVPVVANIDISYKIPLHSGDIMVSKLWLEAKGAKCVFHQDIFDAAETNLIATATVEVVTLKNGKISRTNELFSLISQYTS